MFDRNSQNTLYCRTDVGGAYRWNDAQQEWMPLLDFLGMANGQSNLMSVESIAVNPVTPGYLYLVCGLNYNTVSPSGPSALFRSNNYGASFTQFSLPFAVGGNNNGRETGERLAIDPNLPSTMFYGTQSNGLWKSVNSGATWTQVTSFPITTTTDGCGTVFEQFVASSGSPGSATPTIFAGVSQTGNNLYESTNGGTTWSPVTTGAASTLMPMRSAQDGLGNLYITFCDQPGPNGATIGDVRKLNLTTLGVTDVSPPTGQGGFCGVSVSKQNANEVVVSTLDRWWPHDEIYVSTNGGTSWTAMYDNAIRNNATTPWANWHTNPATGAPDWIGSVEIDPFNSNRVFHGSGGGVFNTTQILATPPITWNSASLGIEESVPLAITTPNANSLLLTALGDIGGFTYHNLNVSPPDADFYNPIGTTNTGIDFAELSPSTVVRVGYLSPNFGAYSTNGGSTWTDFASEPPAAANNPGSIAVAADGGNIVWTPSNSNQYYSTDKGATWTLCSGGTTESYGYPAVADRANPAYFYIYDSPHAQLLVSSNGGASFSPATGPLPYWSAGTPSTVFKHAGDVWVPTWNGLYHSTNFGSTFTQVTTQNAVAVGFGAPQVSSGYPAVYLSGEVGGVYGAFRSLDEGATWTQISDSNHQFGWIGSIRGDERTFGLCYIGAGGRGTIYGLPAAEAVVSNLSYSPYSAVGVAGSSFSGNAASMAAVDGNTFNATSARTSAGTETAVGAYFQMDRPSLGFKSFNLQYTMEAPTGATITLNVYNVATNTWVPLGAAVGTGAMQTETFPLVNTFGVFTDGSNKMVAEIVVKAPSGITAPSFSSQIDQFQLTGLPPDAPVPSSLSFAPYSAVNVAGSSFSGNAASLASVDGNTYNATSARTSSGTETAIGAYFQLDRPSTAFVSMNLQYTLQAPVGTTIMLNVYSAAGTGSWIPLGSVTATGVMQTASFLLPNTAGIFTGANKMVAEIVVRQPSGVTTPFTSETDQLVLVGQT